MKNKKAIAILAGKSLLVVVAIIGAVGEALEIRQEANALRSIEDSTSED